jgi:hypothetical protein
MGYYVIKRDQDVGGTPTDFYYYENEVDVGTSDEAHWGTDASLKEVFSSESDAQAIFNNMPPNFNGAEIVSE